MASFPESRDYNKHKRAEESSRHPHAPLQELAGDRMAELAKANAHLQAEIANRERAETIARESEQRLFQLMEFMPAGVFVVDARGKPYYANRMAQEILGKGIDPQARLDQLAEVYQAYLSGTDIPYPVSKMPIVRALQGEHSSIRDMEIHTPERVVHLYVRGAPIYDSQGQIEYALATFIDITDRKKAEDRQTALYQLIADLLPELDEDEICRRVVHRLHDPALGYSVVGVVLVDEKTHDHVVCAAVGRSDLTAGTWIPAGQGLSRLLLSDELYYSPTKRHDPRDISNTSTGSQVIVPIIVTDKVAGMLVVESNQPKAFDQDDCEALTAVARQAGTAIARARLLASERQRANQLEALSATLADLSAELELPKLLQAVLMRAASLLGVTGGTLAIFDQQRGELVIAASYNAGMDFTGMRVTLGEGVIGKVIQTGQPLIISDYQTWEGHLPHYSESHWHPVLSVPLSVGNRLVGVITIIDSDPTRQFNLADLHLLNLFAPQAAIAIENARLYTTAQRQKEYLEALVENSPVAIVTTDLDFRVASWNPAAERLFGYSQSEAVGHPTLNLVAVTEAQRSGIVTSARQVQKQGRAHAIGQHVRKDGILVNVEALTLPLTLASGQVGYVIIYHDITELQRARVAAESATLAKSEFLANMSHELRTPMNAIIGFSEILGDQTFGALNAKQKRYVNNILTSGRHLLQLINDILDLAKVEAGRLELRREHFDVMIALGDVQTIVKTLASKKNIRLTIETEPDLPLLNADQPKFKQIMYNLLSNAIKFTPDGGSVTVTAGIATEHEAPFSPHTTRPANSPFLRIFVSDTGIGIKPDDYERVFGEFEQIDSSYARQQEGTGLGLALTRKLVELHGGQIWVESDSAAGSGSIFTFIMPFDPPAVSAGATAESGAIHDGAQPQGVHKLAVLVVEDDHQSSELLTLYLSGAGYLVLHASDGFEALQKAREAQPDVIILDVLLKAKDGLAVLAELKTMPETKTIPVIMVSVSDDQTLAFSLGAFDYFVKPIDKLQLIEAVRQAQGMAEKGMTVLVVDDDPKVIELVTDVLEIEGHCVLQASGGQQGIAIAIEQHPDLIVLDLMMPEVSGFEVMQQLCDHPNARDIPILVYTAKNLTDTERRMLNQHVKGVASKVDGKEALLRQIDALKRLKYKV